VEVVEKPSGAEADDAWARRLLSTVKLVSRIKVITHPRARLNDLRRTPVGRRGPRACRAVAIGASTGGPGFVVEILRGLPPDFSLPILLVVHIAPSFAAGFVEWLDRQSALSVRCARDGEPLPARGVSGAIMAIPDRHLVMANGALRLTNDPERHSCRPSVDVLFESVARELGPRVAGCLLTGMGKDGAEGLVAIRRAGGRTFAQDEETSVVFGMPGEAVRRGAAERVLPLPHIAPALTALAAGADEGR